MTIVEDEQSKHRIDAIDEVDFLYWNLCRSPLLAD